jgi:hypothetical protein
VPYVEQPIVVGNEVDFTLYARKDGEDWTLTGGTVTLYLRDPDGNVSSYNATISGTTAHYQADDTVLDEAGDWRRKWRATVGGITLTSDWIEFSVEEGPA